MTNALQYGKKAFTWSVVLTTIVWSMGISALIPLVANTQSASCPSLKAGNLFKVPNNSAVYLLDANLKRLYFPHESVYKTWYNDFSGVVEIASTCVDAYPAPSAAPFGVNYRTGSTLVKVQISPSVYVVEPSNKISKVGSEAVAKDLYGSNWATKVRDIADPFWPNYVGRGAEVTEAKPHEGMLIQKAGSADVYQVKDGKAVKVEGTAPSGVQSVTEAVFNKVAMGTGTVTAASLVANPAQSVAAPVTTTTPATTTTSTAAGTIKIALAADTPSGTYAVSNAARVPFTKLNFTASGGDVTINSFKVKRAGNPARDADFSRVNVVDQDGNLLNDAGKTLNSDGEGTFTEKITVKSGETKAYTIVGDMVSTNLGGGNLPVLQLLSVSTDATVVGTLPLGGNPVTVNSSITLGTVTLAEAAQVGTITKQVASTNVNLANLRVTVATNDFQVERLTLYNAGTVADGDISNIRLTYNNNNIATGVLKKKYLSFDLANCKDDCKILKGNNKTYSVYADLTGGSSRTINLDVQRQAHVLAKDLKQVYYVLPTNNADTMTNTVTVSRGSLNITKVDDVKTGDVSTNATGRELGSWNFKVTGEPIDISTLVFRITTTVTVVPTGFDSLTLFDKAGKALTGGVDGVGAASPGYATSTDTITLKEGDNILTLKATIDSTPANNDTVTIAIDMRNTANFVATGVNSSETLTLNTDATPQSVVSANTQTIKTGALRVTTLPTPTARTYAPGTSSVVFAKVQLNAAGSSEDLRVTQFRVLDVANATALTIDIQNIRLWVDKDGDSYDNVGTAVALSTVQSGTGTTAGNDETFTFNLSGSDQFTIKKGKSLVVEVHGDIAGGATAGTHNFGVSTSDYVTAVGVNTNTQVAEVIDTASGNAMTVGTAGGTVQVSLDSANPVARLFAGGAKGVTLGAFNFLATTTEDVEMDQIRFTMRVTDTASSSFNDYEKIYLEDASGVVVGQISTPTSTTPMMTFASKAFVVKTTVSGGQIMYLKADLSSVGTGALDRITVGGHQVGFNIAAAGDVTGKGAQTGTGSNEYLGTTAPNANTHILYKAIPTVTQVAHPTSKLANGVNDLYRFKVTANTGDIGLAKFTFDFTTSGMNITNVSLVDVTETSEVPLFSNAVTAGSVLGDNGFIEVNLNTDDTGTGQGVRERVVSKGLSRTFVLRGTATAVSSGDSVSTRMAGDSALADGASGNGSSQSLANVLMASTTAVDSGSQEDFIWSDLSVGAHTTSTNDWTNGYLVSGLNSGSSTPTVLSL